jgi:dihydrodipicolinate synthase/N-acetylneuraminate lyase
MTAISSLPFGSLLAASASKKMHGRLMILSTPYDESGDLDYEDLTKEVAFCDQCSVQGIVWAQNFSEQRYLTKAERIRGFEVLAEANRGRSMFLTLGVQAGDTCRHVGVCARG